MTKGKNMSYIDHAKRELEILGYDLNQTEEDPNKWICENVLELLEVFAKQGHSGSSAPYAIDMFSKLARHENLSPLTGDESEWNDCHDDVKQNNRLSNVFIKNGIAYNIDGYVFWSWVERDLYEDEEGYPGKTKFKSCFISGMSRKRVDFPYTKEEPEYIQVTQLEVNKETGEPETGSGWWETNYPDYIVENDKDLRSLLGD